MSDKIYPWQKEMLANIQREIENPTHVLGGRAGSSTTLTHRFLQMSGRIRRGSSDIIGIDVGSKEGDKTCMVAEKQFINEVWSQHWTRLADEANACPF